MADLKETARKPAGLADNMARTVESAVHEAAGQLLDASGSSLKQGTQKAQQNVENAGRFARQQQDQARAAVGRAADAANDIAERSQAGLESAFGSGAAMAQGMQQAVQLWSEFAQNSWRRQIEATQELMRCRTFEEAMRVQSEFVRDSLERFVEGSRRATKLSSGIASDALKGAGDNRRMAAE